MQLRIYTLSHIGTSVIVLVVVLSARLINVIPSIAAQPARRRRNVLENTIHGISETLERACLRRKSAVAQVFPNRVDARMKVISILALLIGVSFSRNLWVIGSFICWRYICLATAIPGGLLYQRVG